MGWKTIIGQARVKELLQRTIANRQVAHAYLFVGQAGIGKDALAIEFAKALLCSASAAPPCDQCSNCKRMDSLQHPNLRFVCALPVGKNEQPGDDPIAVLTAEQVEEIQEHMRQKATDPYHRIEIDRAAFIKINSVREL
ncbi:MAG: hypothetical protein HY966_05225, partial [Ignavibacteriales bacterium]|nr:hypothetical protein [Ignavibacteriales bacterium]